MELQRDRRRIHQTLPLSLIPFHQQSCKFSFLLFSLLFFNYNYCPFYLFLDIFRLSVPLGFGLDLPFFLFFVPKRVVLHMWHSLTHSILKPKLLQADHSLFGFFFSIFKSPSKRNPILELFLFYGRLQDLFFHDSFDAGALICEVNIKIIYRQSIVYVQCLFTKRFIH